MILGFEWLNDTSSQESEEFPTQGRVNLTQSDEEIARWTTDERLTEAEKAVFLLEKGFYPQKTSVLASLPHLLKVSKSASLTATILSQSHKFDETQMNTLGTSLTGCIVQGLVPPSDSPQILHVSELVLECDSEVTCDTWCSVIREVTKVMDESSILSSAVPVVLRLCEFSRPVFIRRCGAELLSCVSAAVPREFIEVLGERVKLLTQDTSYEIRKTMCRVLPEIANDLGTAAPLFPLLETLLTDEEPPVKRESILMLSRLIQLLPSDLISDRILPLLTTEVLVTTDDQYRCNLMLGMGNIVSMLTTGDREVMGRLMEAFLYGLGTTVEAKVNGVKAMCGVAQAVSQEVFAVQLKPVYVRLATDESVKVRRATAVIFHKMLFFLDGFTEDIKYLADAFLRDSNCRWSVIEHIPEWPPALHSFTTFTHLREVLLSTPQWRLQTVLILAIRKLATTELTPILNELMSPALMAILKTGGYALKMNAVKTLVGVMKVTFQSGQRQGLIMRMLEEFAQSKVAGDRVTYIDFSLSVAHSFSASFFRKQFLRNLLSMSVDPVSAVRMRLAMGLEAVKLAVAGEDEASELLHEAMVRLCNDSSELVSRLASDAQGKMMTTAFLAQLESEDRTAEEAIRLSFEASLHEYERTLEEKTRRKIIEDIAAKTRAAHQKDKVQPTKRNSLKIPRSAITAKPRFSFSEDRVDSPRANSPKPAKTNVKRSALRK